MFSYFGSKSKIIHKYPRPVYGKIFEPFAGSARYACRYYDKDVWINDLYPVIVDIWKWIQSATRKDILGLPDLKKGDDLRDCKQLSEVERQLMGFMVSKGCATPHNVYSGYSALNGGIDDIRLNMLDLCGKIAHWKITNLSYDQLPDDVGTWYVDPPYQKMGDRYVHNQSGIDFSALGKWCQSRRGQVIVCEGTGADWLPFQRFIKGVRRMKRDDFFEELVWYRCDKKQGFGF